MTPTLRPQASRVLALLLATFVFAPRALLAASSSVPIYPLAEVKPGLAVEARTVFRGTQSESFPLEVLGVLHQGKADGDLILARATEARIVQTGIVAGMSGSPVYAADGRLLGAIAYSWSFSKEPICGITPIEEMVEIWNLKDESPAADFEGGALPAAESATSSSASLARLRTPLAASGIAPPVLQLLTPWAEQNGFLLTPGGRASAASGSGAATRPARLAPGDAVAVDLLRGDASLSAIGTVTAVDGDRVLAFGHPFFFSGPVRLPMSAAEIVTVIPNLDNSFKIGTSGAPVGTLTQDRRMGVGGVMGTAPAMMPLSVRVTGPGGPATTYHFDVARQRNLTGLAVATAASSAALSRGAVPPQSTWRWKLVADLKTAHEARKLELDDVTTGEGLAVFQALMTPINLLLNNAWEPVDLERLDFDIEIVPRLEQVTVKAVRLQRPRVRPGETVPVEVDLESYRGPTQTVTLEYRVPDTLPTQTLTLFVGGGQDLARFDASQAPGRYTAGSVEELERRFENLPKSSRLYVAVYSPVQELSVRGRDYPGLPASAQVLLSGRESRDASARAGHSSLLSLDSKPYDWIVSGGTTLKVEVDPKALLPNRPSPPAGSDEESSDNTED